MSLIRWQRPETAWSGLDELAQLREEMDQLMAASFGDLSSGRFFNQWAPAINLYQDKDNVVVRAEVPGMKKEDINLSLHDGALTISGERRGEQKREGATHRHERFYGKFQRTVTLPVAVEGDKVKATYKEGVLTITLPKAEIAKPKQIEVDVK